MVNSSQISRTFEGIILYVEVTQETMVITDPNDKMISIDVNKAINKTARDRLIISRDTSHEAQIDYETTHVIVLTAHAHQAFFALEIYIHV